MNKPPTYSAIEAAQKKYKELSGRTREQVKTRCWHMIKTGR
jgi:hypothetical protein